MSSLIIGDSTGAIKDIAVGSRIDVYLNLSDLDVHEEALPVMNRWDRFRFSRHRAHQYSPTLLKGIETSATSLVEITCPLTDELRQILTELQSRNIRIDTIQPLFHKPEGAESTLVVCDHGQDGCRHTLFEGGRPKYTRLTTFNPDEVKATLTYIRNHFGIDEPVVQYHQPAPLRPVSQKLRFTLPQFVREKNRSFRLRFANRMGLAAVGIMFVAGLWQSNNYKIQLEQLDALEIELKQSSDQINQLKADLPLDKLLPQTYKTKLAEPSPIDLFRHVSSILGSDITLSALKWESSPKEERLLLHVRVLTSDIDDVDELKTALSESLPGFEIETQSLPHGSGEQETFAGSASQEDLTLAGDKEKAVIQLTRKKS